MGISPSCVFEMEQHGARIERWSQTESKWRAAVDDGDRAHTVRIAGVIGIGTLRDVLMVLPLLVAVGGHTLNQIEGTAALLLQRAKGLDLPQLGARDALPVWEKRGKVRCTHEGLAASQQLILCDISCPMHMIGFPQANGAAATLLTSF